MGSGELIGPEGFWESWADGSWRPHTHAALACLLDEADAFCDIGAWVGPLALWATEFCSEIVAIEPDPVAFEALEANLRETGATITHAAMALDCHGTTIHTRGDWGDSLSSVVPSGGEAAEVETVDPAWLFGCFEPDVINLNAEGAEGVLFPALAPHLLDNGTDTLLSVHEPLLSRDDKASLFSALDCFGTVRRLRTDGAGYYELLVRP